MKSKSESDLLQEFAEFIEAPQVSPGFALDEIVVKRVESSLLRSYWRLFPKLTLIQIITGLATLTICPQFGIGGGHLPIVHELHSGAPPLIFHLLCGVLFVGFGGLLSGLILRPVESAQISRWRYHYFLAYAATAYLILILAGSEAFVASSLSWIPGAVLGSTAGFSLSCRLRGAQG
ncbi:MAG: hypothetical protein L3J57_13705 [Desulfuromusa sp.]|nr:hypothetical protein [Desulfuromusa sp.]